MRTLAVWVFLTFVVAIPSCRSVAEKPDPVGRACDDCTHEPYWTWERFEEGSHHAPASRAVRRFRCNGCGVGAEVDSRTGRRECDSDGCVRLVIDRDK